ncbi:MAG: response regulator [Myxococcales bacterium]|nr:response regulator [Myxococcales bacterium]MCB9732990.1 response regulator [Deltaproteobacteria bacterium]
MVDLRGEVVLAGGGVARLCRLAPEALTSRPVTSFLRGPAMTAPYGRLASLTIRAHGGGSVAGLGMRELDGDRIRLTVLPASDNLADNSRGEESRLRTVERLVDEVVRDIQNPLTGIVGFSTLAQLAPTPHRRRYYLDQVTTQAQRARRLVQSLDASMRPLVPHPARIDLAEITSQAVATTRLELEGHGISLEVSLPATPVWVEADAKIVGDMLVCLIHRGTLGLRAEFSAREVAVRVEGAEPGGVAIVSIELTGCDVVNDVLPSRFSESEARRAAAQTVSDVEFQTGLDALRVQRAELRSDVSPDRETVTVRLGLPAVPPAPRPDQTRTPVPLDILTIDDDSMMGELYAELLGVSGHSVTACRSLHAAREALRSQRFDAVIADFYLQDGTYAELAAELSADHPELTSRLILITANRASSQVVEWLSHRRGTPVMPKPFGTQALLNRIAVITG